MNIVDLIKLSFEGVKREAQKIIRAANKRATRILKSESALASPAIEKARESRPKGQAAMFSSRGKDRNQLIAEYKRAKSFMESETSTITGVKKHQEAIRKGFEEQGISVENERDMINLFNIYNKLKEQEPAVANKDYRYDLFERINQELDKGLSVRQITAKLSSELENIIAEKNAMDDDILFGADIDDIFW